MKAIKISLAVLVIAAIAYFTIQSFASTDEVGEIQQGPNSFIEKIQQEIGEITRKPDDKFCKDYYTEVAYHIDDYHKNSKFSSNPSDNDQWKNNLSKQLYSAYAEKFIKQAFYVFNRSEWSNSDLNFIRNEYKALQSSSLLERGSPVDQKFNEIQTIFRKYDEIRSFIADCNKFSFPGSESSLQDKFPVDNVKSKIEQSNAYLSRRLDNPYVNNCTRLRDELKTIPQSLFSKHVWYLDQKIRSWSGFYMEYSSQSSYHNQLFTPLREEINALDNSIYNAPGFDSEYTRLRNRLDADAIKAYDYFNSRSRQ